MKHDNPSPTLIFRVVNALPRKTNQLSSLYRAQLVIAPPNQKKICTTVNLEIVRAGSTAPAPLYARSERGRPKKLMRHAALVAEYQYLLHCGKRKLAARDVLAHKYGYSHERAVRRITNAPEWEESYCCIVVQTATTNRPAVVALLDTNRSGALRASNGKVIAISGSGWLWNGRQKFAAWKSSLEIQAKNHRHLYPDLFTNEKYLLARFPNNPGS
jgi:hypothetical protein